MFRRRNAQNENQATGPSLEAGTTMNIGKQVAPTPVPIQKADFSNAIRWNWYLPGFNLAGIVSTIALITAIIGTILLIASSQSRNRAPLVASGLIFYVIAGVLSWFRIVLARNQSYVDAINTAYEKSKEARDIWIENPGPPYLAKDPFFEASAFLGPTLVILRDGTVEEMGNEDEASAVDTNNAVHDVQNTHITENEAES